MKKQKKGVGYMADVLEFEKRNRDTKRWDEWHKATCMGYAIMAAEKANYTEEQIKKLILNLFDVQMNAGKMKTPAEAKKAYLKWLETT